MEIYSEAVLSQTGHACNVCWKFIKIGAISCLKSIVLADYGFRDRDGILENMQICKKGTWNQRMFIETAFSMVTLVADLKRIRHRLSKYIAA